MPLPTLATAKAYLRVQDVSDDAVLTVLLAQATADVELFLGVALTTENITRLSTTAGVFGYAHVQSARSGNVDSSTAVSVGAASEAVGLAAAEASLGGLILELLAEYHERRNPGVMSTSDAGSGVSYATALPPRFMARLRPWRMRVMSWT